MEVENSARKNCPSVRCWIHSGDLIRNGGWENSGNFVTGVGGGKTSTSLFFFDHGSVNLA